MAASDPPTPGRISIKHGKCANGCTGTSEVIRFCDALVSCRCVSPRSSRARDRNSGSVVESFISVESSVTDSIHISHVGHARSIYGCLTLFAESHSFKALTIGLYSPSFLAMPESKPSESLSVRSLCSEAITWARVMRAGGIDAVIVACRT